MLVGSKEMIKEMQDNQLMILTTVMSPTMRELGVLFMGESVPGRGNPKINTYLVRKEGVGFRLEEKLRVYKFKNVKNANYFVKQASEASGLGMLLILSGQPSICIQGK